MKLKTILFLAIFIFSIYSVLGIASYCGDGYCDSGYGEYNESDARGTYYCPADCGIRTTEDWCIDEYVLRSGDCPTCPACNCASGEVCTTSRLTPSELSNWCTGNGFTSNVSYGSGSGSENKFSIWWIIFLVIGWVASYYFYKKKRK
jgi:hypothetical protein